MKMMKNLSLLALMTLMALTTSCQKEETVVSPETNEVTITLATEDVVTTRATSTVPTRYIIEAYSDAAYTVGEDIFGETNQTTVSSSDGTATLNFTIDRTKDYYFLFWSDVNGDEVYTTTSLQAVTLNSDKTPVESWHGTAQISNGTSEPTLGVTLTRAVAKINLMEIGVVPASSSLKMTFEHNTVFSVSSGTVSTTASRSDIIANESSIDGSTTEVQLNSSEIYLFAAVETQTVHDITFTMNTEDSFVVSNVPFQANHATNITGHYTKFTSGTFTLTVDDTWDEENDVVITYAVGDLYPDATNPIGVVYKIMNGGANGMIVSLEEEAPIQWSYNNEITGAYDADNGRNNMTTILSFDSYSAAAYAAFAWVHAKNEGATASTYTDDATGVWYIPAINELTSLYGVMSEVNTGLKAASSTVLSSMDYWSSTEVSTDDTGATAYTAYFTSSSSAYTIKNMTKNSYYDYIVVREVLAF